MSFSKQWVVCRFTSARLLVLQLASLLSDAGFLLSSVSLNGNVCADINHSRQWYGVFGATDRTV